MSVDARAVSRVPEVTDGASGRFGLAWVIAVGIAYGLVHSALRLSISQTLPIDDIRSNVYAQTFELGYAAKQPPLYEWLLWLVQQATGPNLLSFLLLKYALLTATFAFLYLIARRIFADDRWAVLAGLSPLMLYQTGLNLHEGVTQTMGLICAVAATMWAFMRLAEQGRARDYVLFGVAAGLGLLAKYNFAAFLFILLGCAALQATLRARLLDLRMLLSIGIGSAVVAPFAYWLITQGHDLVAVYQSSVAPLAQKSWLEARGIGLIKTVWVPLAFLFPLDAVVLFFPGTLPAGWAAIKDGLTPRNWDRATPDWQLLLLHMTLGGFMVLAIGALATGATHYLERYMHPFFLLTPLWLLALVAQSGNATRRLAILAVLFVGTALLVVPVRSRDLLSTMAGDCRKCRIAVPYQGLAAALKERGFRSGTIIAATSEDAGNLRRFFPEARIVRLEPPRYAPRARAAQAGDKLAVVWRDGKKLRGSVRKEHAEILRGLGVAPEQVSVVWPTGTNARQRVFNWLVIVTDAPPE